MMTPATLVVEAEENHHTVMPPPPLSSQNTDLNKLHIHIYEYNVTLICVSDCLFSHD